MPQKVCELDPNSVLCEHDRIGDFWGDMEPGMILGANLSEDDFMGESEQALVSWGRIALGYCGSYLAQEHTGLSVCEQAHQQRVALDLVRLLAIMERRRINVGQLWR